MLKPNRQTNEQLDRVGKLVLRAGSGNDSATETAASAPFLYSRVRAGIAAERRRLDDAGSWLSLLFVARRAIPAMALVAILTAVLTLLSINVNAPASSARFDEDAFFDARDNSVEQTILADRNGLSRDEVFSIVVDRNDREKR